MEVNNPKNKICSSRFQLIWHDKIYIRSLDAFILGKGKKQSVIWHLMFH